MHAFTSSIVTCVCNIVESVKWHLSVLWLCCDGRILPSPSGTDRCRCPFSGCVVTVVSYRCRQVRIAALTVLADSKKTSELFEPTELRLIVRFVAANLANQSPAFRQQLLALMKKVRTQLTEPCA